MTGRPSNPGNPELTERLTGLTQAEVWAYVEANLFVDFVNAIRCEVDHYAQPTPVKARQPEKARTVTELLVMNRF